MAVLLVKRPRVLERTVEAAFVRAITKMGCATRKLNGAGARSWPDRLVLGPCGLVMFVELKRPGGVATGLQRDLFSELSNMGHDVRIFDDAGAATAAVVEKLAWLKSGGQ